jgi:hypothetical protein
MVEVLMDAEAVVNPLAPLAVDEPAAMECVDRVMVIEYLHPWTVVARHGGVHADDHGADACPALWALEVPAMALDATGVI